MNKRKWTLWLAGLVLLTPSLALATTQTSKNVASLQIQEENVKCINCHLKENNSLVQQWKNSPHAAALDGQVGCYNCHAAEQRDPTGYMHEGAFIKTIQSPSDCQFCHEVEVNEMSASHHATAGQILDSLDNVLAELVTSMESNANSAAGCWQCHGSKVEVLTDDSGDPLLNEHQAVLLDPKTYPNTGIGRMNPDGTMGSCIACHGGHSFRAATARQPESCGKCHLGPDHPQMESYRESRHGIGYYTAIRERGVNAMNILKRGKWVLGKDYYTAPTCATCHMGSTLRPDGSVTTPTHNVGDRISWNLREPISQKMDRVIFANGDLADIPEHIEPEIGQEHSYTDYEFIGSDWERIESRGEVVGLKTWEMRREEMEVVCRQCHGVQVVDHFYEQFDEVVVTYNEKFARPAATLYELAEREGLIAGSPFNSRLGWYWWELWHHEGRRARIGASKMAPDFTHRQGLYEVADNFYNQFIPELARLAEAAGKQAAVQPAIDRILSRPEHQWFQNGGEPPE